MLDYYRQLPQVMGIVTTTAAGTTTAAENNNNINDNNSTMIVMPHDPTSNNCKCDRCTDLERRF
jgi:hypothetical protein